MPERLPNVFLVDDSDAFRGSAGRYLSQRLPLHVVMVRSHDDAGYRAAAREAGADGLIAKADFTIQVLTLLRDTAVCNDSRKRS